MSLTLYSFQDFVNAQVAAMQAQAAMPLDFDVGSNFLAFVEANAGQALALQAQASYDLAVARLTTSTGSNVDSFTEQFQLYRKQATNAYGIVTFSRFTDTQEAIIPAGNFDLSTLGALVYSPVSQLTYSVYIDIENEYYDPTLTAYVIPISTASADIPVVATTAGAIGNVLANQINTIYSVIPYVDTVTNAEPIDTGEDQETDAQLKIRFVLYINGLSKANYDSVAAAILSVEGVERYKIVEFYDIDNNPMPGYFYVVIDDGTGNASDTLLANVQAAVYAVRALGIAFSVYAPTATPISVTAHVWTNGSVPDDTVQAEVEAALTNYILTQSFDATFPYSRIPEIIYDADTSIINVTSYLLNGSTSDVTISGTDIMTVGTLDIIMNA
jgi:uncharacterized phage protein gp47/JayE